MEEKEPQSQVKDFIALLQEYIGKKLELLKLEGVDVLTRVFSSVIVYLILAIILFLMLMMMSILGGLFFAKLFDSNLAGFGLVAVLYLVLFIVIYSCRKLLVEKFFAPQILKMIFNDDDDED